MPAAAERQSYGADDLSSPYYFNTSHWRAKDGVAEGVGERAGIMLLTGPTGSGKTMLMRAIAESLPEGATPLFLNYASLNFREFVNFLHGQLGVSDEVPEEDHKAVALKKFLYLQAERGETAVVFVDEAQNLEPDVLRMLPKLAGFDELEDGSVVGLQFVLVGGSELREVLDDEEFEDVRKAVARSYELRFFTREELRYFLAKRLAPIARLTPEPITEDAIEAVGRYTGGSPRLIGMICSHAMLFAAENPGRSIDAAMVEEAAEAQMIEEVERPFAHEDDEPELTGPYSSADLDEEGDGVAIGAAVDPSSEPELAAEPAYMAGELDGDGDFAIGASDVMDDVEASFDDAALRDDFEGYASMEEVEASFDDDFGHEGDDLADPDAKADVAIAAGAATAGGGSLLARIGAKLKGGKPERKRMMGASRKGGGTARTAQAVTKRKAPRTRVAGQREKQVKIGVAAAACIALVFGAWTMRDEIGGAFASAKRSVGETASNAAGRVQDVAGAAVGSVRDTVETAREAAVPAPAPRQVVQTPQGAVPVPTAKPGGWGATVVVAEAETTEIPEGGVNIARGALDFVDRALEGAQEMAPDSMRGTLAVMAGDVDDARRAVTANGAEGEALAARVSAIVQEGDALFAKGLYVAPSGGNAYDAYRKALDLDSDNEGALRGIEKLAGFYNDKASAARKASQFTRANRHYERAIAISRLRPVN